MKTRILGVALVVMGLGMGNSALAQEAYDWSGVYIGAHGGFSFSDSSYDHVETFGVGGAERNREAFDVSPSGLSGGLQAGVLKQFGRFVVGAEAAYDFYRADDDARTDLNGIPRTRETEIGGIWNLSAKTGYAWERTLGYVKAGYANTKLTYTNTRIADGVVVGESEHRAGGLLLGVGLEHAFTEKWSVGAEYNFMKFNVGSQQQTRNGAPVAAYNDGNDLSVHNLSVRLNYRF